MRSESVSRGDPAETTTEQGSLYADPENERLVRLSDPENHDDYRVEVFTTKGSETEMWSFERVRAFARSDDTEYLAGHCFDGYSPYGVWTSRTDGHPCPECGKFMKEGFYHGGGGRTARKFYPGLVCPDHESPGRHCPGRMEFQTANERGIYVTAHEYVKVRFGEGAT